MKNQYFGDINDYRKYGLIRSIIQSATFRPLIAWMLTPDDGSPDGKFVSYLENPNKWSHHDPVLFQELKELLDSHPERRVSLIHRTKLLPDVGFFDSLTPDRALERMEWFGSLVESARDHDFVFLDPDNGLEVKSKPYGRKNSSKYLYWREVEALWSHEKSLLIYQHYIRESRVEFTQRNLESLRVAAPGSLVEAFSTPHVVFLMALQPPHHGFHKAIVESVLKSWKGQIEPTI